MQCILDRMSAAMTNICSRQWEDRMSSSRHYHVHIVSDSKGVPNCDVAATADFHTLQSHCQPSQACISSLERLAQSM